MIKKPPHIQQDSSVFIEEIEPLQKSPFDEKQASKTSIFAQKNQQDNSLKSSKKLVKRNRLNMNRTEKQERQFQKQFQNFIPTIQNPSFQPSTEKNFENFITLDLNKPSRNIKAKSKRKYGEQKKNKTSEKSSQRDTLVSSLNYELNPVEIHLKKCNSSFEDLSSQFSFGAKEDQQIEQKVDFCEQKKNQGQKLFMKKMNTCQFIADKDNNFGIKKLQSQRVDLSQINDENYQKCSAFSSVQLERQQQLLSLAIETHQKYLQIIKNYCKEGKKSNFRIDKLHKVQKIIENTNFLLKQILSSEQQKEKEMLNNFTVFPEKEKVLLNKGSCQSFQSQNFDNQPFFGFEKKLI